MGDTIAAVATAPGPGAIGVVRVSGPEAEGIASRLFSPRDGRGMPLKSHEVRYGLIVDGDEIIDEAILFLMKGPRSFTREDVVEIQIHGGPAVLRRVLSLVLEYGARMADPGEFTRRAFLNGRIDLSQAEAVADLVAAETDAGRRIALRQLEGELGRRVRALRSGILKSLAVIEAGLDFPEEDLEELTGFGLVEDLEGASGEVEALLKGAGSGKILREGLRTVIVGRPNVGKSSLLNALLREERAIVTEVAGTTRDVITETLNVGGIPIIVMDTAGIREPGDQVERLGVQRSRESLKSADLVLFVLDDTAGIEEEDRAIAGEIEGKKTVVLVNKVDVGLGMVAEDEVKNLLPAAVVVRVSARDGSGIEELAETIEALALEGQRLESVLVSNERHIASLREAHRLLKEALASARAGLPLELVAADLRSAVDSLGEVTGDSIGEEVLDLIFARFCIGK